MTVGKGDGALSTFPDIGSPVNAGNTSTRAEYRRHAAIEQSLLEDIQHDSGMEQKITRAKDTYVGGVPKSHTDTPRNRLPDDPGNLIDGEGGDEGAMSELYLQDRVANDRRWAVAA